MSPNNLFKAITVGNLKLQHRVVVPPLTRFRADENHVPSKMAPEYYAQRAETPGSLLITEATDVSHFAGGYAHIPGIYSAAQIAGWKKVTEAVHAKGSFIFMQIWSVGRASDTTYLKSINAPFVAPSSIALKSESAPEDVIVPREMSIEEIHQLTAEFVQAAKNAIEAGFDGVEVHAANGYTLDQFQQDVSNTRTDSYGGSIENRSRLTLETLKGVVDAIGAKRTGIRFSPFSRYQDMGATDIKGQFTYLVQTIHDTYPELAYLHLVEPRINGSYDAEDKQADLAESNDFLRYIWAPRPLITAGGWSRTSAIEQANKRNNELFGFGRAFVSNPDLVERIRNDWGWTKSEREHYYVPGSVDPVGYTSYTTAKEARL